MSFIDSLTNALPALDSLKPHVQPPITAEAFTDAPTQYMKGSQLGLLGDTTRQPLSVVAVSDQFIRWTSLRGDDFARTFGYEFIVYEITSSGGRVLDRMPMPLNPQSIRMSVPAATSLSVTMKGIIEESNGAPLRPIRVSGTTGMLPIAGKPAGANANTSNALEDIAAYALRNTLNSVNRTINQASRTIAAFKGSPQKMSYLNYQPDDVRGITTGYEFFHRLARFFDYYLAAKKQNRQLRLAFHMYKDQMYWDVSLGGYDFTKVQGSMEYTYDVQLTAYRRRPTPDLFGARVNPLAQRALQPTQVDALNALASVVNGIRQAKVALAQSFTVLAGIRADIESTFITPVNELNMFVTNLANLPRQAIEYYRVVGLAAMGQAFSDAYYGNWKNGFDIKESDVSNAGISADVSVQGNLSDALAQQGESDSARLSGDTRRSVEAGTSPISGMISDKPANNTLNEGALSQLFKDVNPDDLPLDDASRQAMQDEDTRLSLLTPDDFRQRRDRIAAFAASVSESFGGGSTSYNRVNGLPSPLPTFRTLGTEEIDVLDKLNDIMIGYDSAIRYMENLTPDSTNDFFSYWSEQARAANIPFQDSSSVFYAPVPHGASIEAIALTYLGDAQRWVEIVAVNSLRPPYIDEDGFDVKLVGSGAGNSITVATSENLYVGQKVVVKSLTQSPSPRKITEIDVLSSSETLVTLDGDPDLSRFTVADSAHASAFLPGTVNSQSLIAIPSDRPVSVSGKIKTTPGVDDLNGLLAIAKADLLLSMGPDAADFVIGSDGDARIAFGLTNLIQAAIIKIRTRRMSLVNDPQFGNGVEAGTSVAELDARKYLDELNQAFKDDRRFEGLQAAKVTVDGPVMSVNALVRVANTDVYLPVAARVPI